MERTQTRPADLQAAARQHHTLNSRQEDTLRLLAEGKTNPEIADALGMTLDGAKWNVSEILSKLGFSSREEAAEYYRWRQRPSSRVRRWARSFLGMPMTKWLLGGSSAAVVSGAVLVGVAMARDDDDPVEGKIAPFYLAAQVTVTDNEDERYEGAADPTSSETSGPGSPSTPPEVTTNTLEWWFGSNAQNRYRIGRDVGDIEVVTNGPDVWSYDGQLNTYRKGPAPKDWPNNLPLSPGLGTFMGPIPGGSIEEMMRWFGYGTAPDFAYERVGSTEMLGRDVTIVEYTPASRSGSGPDAMTGEGVGRIFVDEDDGIILRYQTESSSLRVDMVVTEFEWVERHDTERFTFVPPPGATEIPPATSPYEMHMSASSNGGSLNGGDGSGGTYGVTVPPGYLLPAYLPEGFRSVSASTEESSGLATRLRITFRPDMPGDVRSIVLDETVRQTGLQGPETAGEIITLRGEQAFVVEGRDSVRLTWRERGHVVVLTGAGIKRAELLLVAERMVIQQ